MYKWDIENYLKNSLDKKKDLDHEVERHYGQCCPGNAALPHPESGTATLSISTSSWPPSFLANPFFKCVPTSPNNFQSIVQDKNTWCHVIDGNSDNILSGREHVVNKSNQYIDLSGESHNQTQSQTAGCDTATRDVQRPQMNWPIDSIYPSNLPPTHS